MSNEETLIEFPCRFPIKVMGKAGSNFEELIASTLCHHVEDMEEVSITSRLSAKGNYVSLTVTVTATSRDQLDNIYRAITALDEVLMAL